MLIFDVTVNFLFSQWATIKCPCFTPSLKGKRINLFSESESFDLLFALDIRMCVRKTDGGIKLWKIGPDPIQTQSSPTKIRRPYNIASKIQKKEMVNLHSSSQSSVDAIV